MDIEKTKEYYRNLNEKDLCDCVYCRNYIGQIRTAYPKISNLLQDIGVDITKPFETIPLDPDENNIVEYIAAQYVVFGDKEDFECIKSDDVIINIAQNYPSTEMKEPHFVVEIHPIFLKMLK